MVMMQHQQRRLFLDAEMADPPIFSGRSTITNSFAPNDSNFDSNMVIILAALLCALICAVGLNSIVRCALRFSQGQSLDGENQSPAVSTTPKKEAMVAQIPVVVIKAGSDFGATECPICLGEFDEGENVRILPKCNHGFHVKCIDKWLVSHSSCPICRQLLFQQTA